MYEVWDLLENTESSYETYDEELGVFDFDVNNEIIVKKEDGKFLVQGGFMERLLESTFMDDEDSLRYFQETLRRKGIVAQLKTLGITEGESVFICEYEFEFFE